MSVEAWAQAVGPGNEKWMEVLKAARPDSSGIQIDFDHSRILAWSLKFDHLGCPPRLSEEAIVLLRLNDTDTTNRWLLAFVGRKPDGGDLDREWSVFDFPLPMVNSLNFQTQPTDGQICSFIKMTNFGYNEFYPRREVSTVILYTHSDLIEGTLRAGLPDSERAARHTAHLKSISY